MSDPNQISMHYTGLDGLGKSAAIWGGVGIVCALILSPRSPGLIAGAVAGGAFVGAVNAALLYRMQLKWIDAVSFMGILTLVGYLFFSGSSNTALGSLGLGALYTAAANGVMLWLGGIAQKKLNEKNAALLQALYGKKSAPPTGDFPTTLAELLSVLPQPLANEISASFVPVTSIELHSPQDDIPALTSSYGGLPRMSSAHKWPHRKKVPLEYLAQINLSELAEFLPVEAPREGLLSFFYDSGDSPWGDAPDDVGSAVIHYSPSADQTEQAQRPDGEGPALSPQRLTFHKAIGQAMSEDLTARFYVHVRSLPPHSKDHLWVLNEHLSGFVNSDNRAFSRPCLIQNPMDDELSIAAGVYGMPEDTEWIMLLQVGSVEEQGWCWGDAGCLYFWIPREDLAAARFDRPWVVLQCT